jgi:hypothetical protein
MHERSRTATDALEMIIDAANRRMGWPVDQEQDSTLPATG